MTSQRQLIVALLVCSLIVLAPGLNTDGDGNNDANNNNNNEHINNDNSFSLSSSEGKELRLSKRSAMEFFENCCSSDMGLVCNCCASYIQQNLCGNMTLDLQSFLLSFDLSYNSQALISSVYSANELPPFCVPLLPGLPFPLPLVGCVQLHDLSLQSNIFHTCANFLVNIASFNLFEQRVGCIDVPMTGRNGRQPKQPQYTVIMLKK